MATLKVPMLGRLGVLILGGAGLAVGIAGACGEPGAGEEAEQIAVQAGHAHSAMRTIDHIPAQYQMTPGGVLVHQDCVHEVPSGAYVHDDLSVTLNGKKIAQYSECVHESFRFTAPSPVADPVAAPSAAGSTPAAKGQAPTGNGWMVASIGFSTESMFTEMDSGYWMVPPAPPVNDGQLLFYFPSVQNDQYIVQPVLQWGVSALGGGAFWAVANWCVMGNGSGGVTKFHTALTRVNVGDELYGSVSMQYANSTKQTWNTSITDASTGYSANVTGDILDVSPFNNAEAGVLEAYGIVSCNDFPNGSAGWTYFSQPVTYQGNSYGERTLFVPAWFLASYGYLGWNGPICNSDHSTVDSVGNTTLDY
jgi:hypothetical protein